MLRVSDDRSPGISEAKIVLMASHTPRGGIRELWNDLAEGLIASGYNVSLVGLYPHPGGAEPQGSGTQWQYLYPRLPIGPLAFVRMVRSMARWLRRDRPDIVITGMPAANVLLAPVARLCSPTTRVILSHHNNTSIYRRELNILDRFVGRLRNVKSIVSVSDAVRSSLNDRSASYRRKCLVIHNSVSPRIEALLAALAKQRTDRTPGKILMMSGRLEPVKNHETVIRAMADVPDAQMHVIGDGSLRASLEQLAEQLGISNRIRFLGGHAREEGLTLLAKADAFVQVSMDEGHSLALIEASKLGLPLIVSRIPSQVEAVTDTEGRHRATIVDAADVAALARAMNEALHNQVTRKHLEEGARLLAPRVTFEVMLRSYIALIEAHCGAEADPAAAALIEAA